MHTSHGVLTRGLLHTFAGKTKCVPASRGGIAVTTSHMEENGSLYHDEWAADRVGAGQELVRYDGLVYTRVYAGGTIAYEAMEKLGITKHDVIGFLIASLNSAGDQTRLCTQYGPVSSDEWEYAYAIIEDLPDIPLTVGKEEIRYKHTVVFIHMFLLCPVE